MGIRDWFRGRKGGKAGAGGPALGKPRWLSAEESPFGIRTLDLRPVTEGMMSATKDPANAARALSWRGATARDVPAFDLGAGETVACALEYPIAPAFPDGLLFAAREMEEKWALFHQRGAIVAVRSWTGQVVAVAQGSRSGDRLSIASLTTFGGGVGPSADRPATFDWLVRTHALGETLPLPVSEAELELLAAAPLAAFSLFGRMAGFAAAGFSPPAPARPLRVFGAVVQAVLAGDAVRVRAELAEKADPNVPSPIEGFTALHLAMAKGEVALMRALLAAGVDPKATTDRGMDPLGLGIVHGAPPAILEELVAAGGTLGGANVDGFGLLHAAAETNRAEIVDWLVARGAALEARTGRGLTPLHVASGLGHAEAARALLAAGADARAASPLGTPRAIAEKEGHPAVAALFPPPAS